MIYYVKWNETKKPIGVYRSIIEYGFLEVLGRNKKWIEAPSTSEGYLSRQIELEKIEKTTAMKIVKKMLDITDEDLKGLFK
ncbi:MAG TPA: hypothetical protein PKK91_07705 [bacterium]|nr:hypothetical protein [bacterium]